MVNRRRPMSAPNILDIDVELPGVGEDGIARKESAVKARNHSRVASALLHSEGIAYKPPCGEIAMCLRVGRMRPIK